MRSIYQSVRENWLSSGTSVNGGTSPALIRQFQDKHKIIVPEEFREYLMTSNGMQNYETDETLISFLPLELIDPVVSPRIAAPNVVDIVFADYLLYSHFYALRSTTDGKQLGIYALDGENEKEIARTFGDFLHAYLANPERIADCW